MTLIDISRRLSPTLAVWPGDTPFSLQTMPDMQQGTSVNLTTLTMSAHTGSHVDAPRHYQIEGESLEMLDLQPYWGPAQVVTVRKPWGPLLPSDLADLDLTGTQRLLVHSASSHRDPTVFDRQIIYPSPELADYLGSLGIVLFGSDAPSMDHVDSDTLPGHQALQRNRIAILEGLDLSQAPDGHYELVALPLKIVGGDGSPVRAVLRTPKS